MDNLERTFQRDGFIVVGGVADPEQCQGLIECFSGEDGAGSRNLLEMQEIENVAIQIKAYWQLQNILADRVAVQCTSFIKSQAKNWAVRLHRDRVIPATGGSGWESSGIKDGMEFVRPSNSILRKFIAVRLNLDHADEGDLQVVPGSHNGQTKSKREEAVAIPVAKGGALVMRPLLEHASTKLKNSAARRTAFLVWPTAASVWLPLVSCRLTSP